MGLLDLFDTTNVVSCWLLVNLPSLNKSTRKVVFIGKNNVEEVGKKV